MAPFSPLSCVQPPCFSHLWAAASNRLCVSPALLLCALPPHPSFRYSQYFPSLSQPIGEVSRDTIQIYGLPTPTTIATTPSLSFKGNFGCITRQNDLSSLQTKDASSSALYTELLPYVDTCPPPVFAPANCTKCNSGIDKECPVLESLGTGDSGPFTTYGELCRWGA